MSVKPIPDDHPNWPSHAKTGLLLVNLGTPDATDKKSMRRYLKQFLSDDQIFLMLKSKNPQMMPDLYKPCELDIGYTE